MSSEIDPLAGAGLLLKHDPRRVPLWRVANNWERWFLWRSGTSTSPDPFHRGDDGQIAYYQTAEIAQDVADRLNAQHSQHRQ